MANSRIPELKPEHQGPDSNSVFGPAVTGAQVSGHSIKVLLARRLLITGLMLSILAATAYSYLSSNTIAEFYKKEGMQATENLAQLSELALLYDSGDHAQEAAIATLNFPSIKHVAIINKANNILFSEGDTNDPILATLTESELQSNIAQFVETNFDTWQIVAPVYSSIEYDADPDIMLDNNEDSANYLGYVAIQVDASQVREAQKNTIVQNLLIGLGYGLAFLVVVFIALGRILKPMSALATLMNQSKDGAYLKSEISSGTSQEIETISEAYNRMISALEERDYRLRSQKELLETEVALRTSELIQARDTALEANKHKSEFLANVTHELRTPLQSILGYAEILDEMLEDEGLEHCSGDVDKISRNANHLLDLINSILDIAKIEAGKMDVHPENTDMHSVIQRAVDTVQPLVEKNNSQLQTEIDLPEARLFIDGKKIYQVLLNLLSNAAKFTQSGTVSVYAKSENGLLSLQVTDTGIGMTSEQQRMVFEPFRQLDGSETRKFEGTGLGLSIVLRFTEMLGGQVRLDSKVGEGSTFTIEIPLELESDQRQQNNL